MTEQLTDVDRQLLAILQPHEEQPLYHLLSAYCVRYGYTLTDAKLYERLLALVDAGHLTMRGHGRRRFFKRTIKEVAVP